MHFQSNCSNPQYIHTYLTKFKDWARFEGTSMHNAFDINK